MQKHIACALVAILAAGCGPVGTAIHAGAHLGASAAAISNNFSISKVEIEPLDPDQSPEERVDSLSLYIMSDQQICERSTDSKSSDWTSEQGREEHVREAKRRQLSPAKCRALALTES